MGAIWPLSGCEPATEVRVHVLPLTSGRVPAGAPIRITPDTGRAAGLAWTPDSRAVVFSLGRASQPLPTCTVVFSPGSREWRQRRTRIIAVRRAGSLRQHLKHRPSGLRAEARDASIWKIPLTGGENPPIPALIVPSTLNGGNAACTPPTGTRLAFASTRSGSEETGLQMQVARSPYR